MNRYLKGGDSTFLIKNLNIMFLFNIEKYLETKTLQDTSSILLALTKTWFHSMRIDLDISPESPGSFLINTVLSCFK